jgi:tetratricopeptide (TPR) repeat protein/CHAT domain-containing protein
MNSLPDRGVLRGLDIAAMLVVLLSSLALAENTSTISLETIRQLMDEAAYGQAESQARELLRAVTAEADVDSLMYAQVTDALVECMWREGKAGEPESRAMAESAIAIKARRLGADDPGMATSLYNLAVVQQQSGDLVGSIPTYEQALAIWQRTLGPDDLQVARCLNGLGGALARTGDFTTAVTHCERALAIRERSLGPNHLDVAASLNNLGNLHAEQGEYDQAMECLERTLAIREAALGSEHPDVADVLENLGSVSEMTGAYDKATLYHERALAIRTKAFGADSPPVGGSYMSLGNVSLHLGHYVEARQSYERALSIWDSALGPEHPNLAWALNNLGAVLERLGDYPAAREDWERALAIVEKSEGPDSPRVAMSHANLGMICEKMNDYPQAAIHYEQALVGMEKTWGPDHPELVTTLNNLGVLNRLAGDYEQARMYQERAVAICETSMGLENPESAWAQQNLAAVLVETGDYAAARPYYERALSIRETALGASHPDVASSLAGLAGLDFLEGDTASALSFCLRAEQISRDHLRLCMQGLSEREALNYATTRTRGLDLAVTIAVSGLDAPSRERVWDSVIRSRANVLDEMGARRQMALSGAEEEDPSSREWITARTRLANLIVRGAGDRSPEEFRETVNEARKEEERAERAMAGAGGRLARIHRSTTVGADEIAAALPPSDILVSYVRYQHVESRRSDQSARYAAFVRRGDDGNVEVVPLGPAAPIEQAVREWRRQIERLDGEAAVRTSGEDLRSLIWDPIAPRVGSANRVFIVPDAAVSLVNLAALPDGASHYLVESWTFHLLSAERDLVPMETEPRTAGNDLLVLADPDYDASVAEDSLEVATTNVDGGAAHATYRGSRPACAEFRSLTWPPLPETAGEAQTAVRLWDSLMPGARSMYLKGPRATERAFKRHARGMQAIHLATHGFFLRDCSAARSAATRGSVLIPAGVEDAGVAEEENPLLLSGLVLAGGNHGADANTHEEDGILTAEEVAALDLQGTNWVVLSACQTGVGEVQVGEGVMGLRRAFQIAGAATLIMSLWSVDDEATREWMTALYDGRLRRKLSTADAVRSASLAMLQARRAKGASTHPFYWGGFVAAGGWK